MISKRKNYTYDNEICLIIDIIQIVMDNLRLNDIFTQHPNKLVEQLSDPRVSNEREMISSAPV